MSKIKVAILSRSFGKASERPFEMLKEHGFEYVLNRNNEPENVALIAELIGDADATIVGSEIINEEVLSHCPNLKMISKHGVGLDSIDLDACKERNVKVTITANANNEAVADLTIMLMLNVLRDLKGNLITSKSPNWVSGPLTSDLNGSVVGIVGFGHIGRCVAKRLLGFGCHLLVYDPFVKDTDLPDTEVTELETLLKNSDIISIHAPLNDQTRNMISAQAISMMKDGAYVFNTARGGLLDYDALYEALKSGKIKGAGLDVYPVEPPVDEPLLTLPNVIATPHIATHTTGSNIKMGIMAVQNIIDHFDMKKGEK